MIRFEWLYRKIDPQRYIITPAENSGRIVSLHIYI